MRVCCVTVLAALALRSAAEPARREWRAREVQRSLTDIFEPDPAPAQPDAIVHYPIHRDRRRMRNYNKRTQTIPAEIASQMMLRASRSGRPYDVPQIGK